MAEQKLYFRGFRVCSCLKKALPVVEKELIRLGSIKKDLSGLIYQGSYRNSVEASAGTHNGGGVIDVEYRLVDTEQERNAFWRAGLIPFPRRSWEGSWVAHGHIVAIGCPHRHWTAANQENDIRKGKNGLANHKKFDFKIPAKLLSVDAALALLAAQSAIGVKPTPALPRPVAKHAPFSGANVRAARLTGKKDGNVGIVQRKLISLGYNLGKSGADGIWGKDAQAPTQAAYDLFRWRKGYRGNDYKGAPGNVSLQQLLGDDYKVQ